jgi:hypothetical protein
MNSSFSFGTSAWCGFSRRLFGSVILAIFAVSGESLAHLDPPTDPPLMTQVEIDTLTFLTDVDDGTNGLAELRVVYTLNWGGDHGSTVYMWSKDHNFDTVAPPYSPMPPNLIVGTHLECSPAAAVTVQAKAYESDAGIDPFADLLIAVGGGAVGGILGSVAPGAGTAAGAGAGAALAAGLLALAADFFNSDDPLFHGTDYTSTFVSSVVALPPGPCSAPAMSFNDTYQEGYCAAAEATDDPQVAFRYTEYAMYGVDEVFPFGRNAGYSSGRYAFLKAGLAAAESMVLEYGGTSDISAKQVIIREAAADFGRIVASAAIDEAYAAGVPSDILTVAQNALSSGDTAVDYGDYTTGVAYYEDVSQVLLPEMFPEFANPTNPCSVVAVPSGSLVSNFVLVLALILVGSSLCVLGIRRRS